MCIRWRQATCCTRCKFDHQQLSDSVFNNAWHLCLMLMQASQQQAVFDRLQWWQAFDARYSLQSQQLSNAVREQHKPRSTSEGSWIQGLFKGKPQQNLQVNSQTGVMSETDIGRVQLQLRTLIRTQKELCLIRCTVEAAPSIWINPEDRL